MLAGGGAAQAAPAVRSFAPTQSPAWNALAADGTQESSVVTVTTAEVGPASALPSMAGLNPSATYFYVALYPSYPYSNAPQVPITIPTTTAVTLGTAQGSVAGLVTPQNSLTTVTSWYFPVPGTITQATLDIASFTVSVPNVAGDWTPWTFSPISIAFTGPPPAPAPPTPAAGRVRPQARRPAGPTVTPRYRANRDRRRSAGRRHSGRRSSSGPRLGGLVVLGAGAAALSRSSDAACLRTEPIARAGWSSSVRQHSSPAPCPGEPWALDFPRARHEIVVKLLGWLEVEGTKRPITEGPLLELIVYLVLNPGRSFTSIQLRESIWGLGRQPITSGTFRNYMSTSARPSGPASS